MGHALANSALNLSLGSRIQVFWPLDAAWYTGTVTVLDGLRGMVEYDDGDIEELNLSGEKVRLLDSAPAGEAEEGGASKRHKSGPGKAEAAGGGTLAFGTAAPASPHGERLLVRFANPNVGGVLDAEGGGGVRLGGGGGGGGGGGAHGAAPQRSHKAGAGGVPGAPPPRTHKAGAGAGPGDRGATADGARALVNFSDKGPAWSAHAYGPADAAAVRNWLTTRGMGKYAPLFEANEVDMATLPYLTLQDLRDLPIHAVGPRRKLMAALERM